MPYSKFISQLEKALQQELPGKRAHAMMAPSSRNPKRVEHHLEPILSAVTLLLYPIDGEWHLPLIKRNVYKGNHSAQISFPGGKMDAVDSNLQATAIRETFEEIGVSLKKEDFLGKLSPLYIPISNFMVHPYVAVLKQTPSFNADQHEVKHIIEYPIKHLFDSSLKDIINIESQDHQIIAPVFQLSNDYIWGATAMILSEFAEIIKPTL